MTLKIMSKSEAIDYYKETYKCSVPNCRKSAQLQFYSPLTPRKMAKDLVEFYGLDKYRNQYICADHHYENITRKRHKETLSDVLTENKQRKQHNDHSLSEFM